MAHKKIQSNNKSNNSNTNSGRRSRNGKPQQSQSNKRSGRNRNIRSTQQGESISSDQEQRQPDNDIEWYNADPALLRDACSIPFYNPTGRPIHGVLGEDFTIPGLVNMWMIPTIGQSTDALSPINVAARRIYSFVRYQNNKSATYEAADINIYLCAMSEIISFHSWLVRIYGLVTTWSQQNRYIPRVLLEAMHVDYNDIAQHLPDFRMYINIIAAQIESMAVPATMSYFIRHAWLYSNVYTDDPTPQASLYMFNPAVFYRYCASTNPHGGELQPNFDTYISSQASNYFNFEMLKAWGDSLIYPVLSDEDMNVMSGDILKAFGEGALYKCGRLPEDYVVIPTYSEVVLTQINNATIAPIVDLATLKITQENGTLLCDPRFGFPEDQIASMYPYLRSRLLNMDHDNPDPQEVMEATRLMTTFVVDKEDPTKLRFSAVGSEFICRADIWSMNRNGTFVNERLWYNRFYDLGETNQLAYYINQIETNFKLNRVNKHPYTITTLQHENMVKEMLCGDITVSTTVDARMLSNMHEVALFSMFSLPTMGSWDAARRR